MRQETKADIVHWALAQRTVAHRIAEEARRENLSLDAALSRVDELRAMAKRPVSARERARAERENLAFHRTWARVRRAFGLG